MSPDHYRNQIQTSQKRIASLQSDKSREAGKISDYQKRAASAAQTAARSSSQSTVLSKQREIERLNRDIATAQKRIASIEDRISKETTRISKAQHDLAKEESCLSQNQAKEADKRHRETTRHMSNLTSQVKLQNQQLQKLLQPPAEIRILFIAANPLDQGILRLDEEAREIEALIRGSDHRDSIRFHSHWAARPLDLDSAFRQAKAALMLEGIPEENTPELFTHEDQPPEKIILVSPPASSTPPAAGIPES